MIAEPIDAEPARLLTCAPASIPGVHAPITIAGRDAQSWLAGHRGRQIWGVAAYWGGPLVRVFVNAACDPDSADRSAAYIAEFRAAHRHLADGDDGPASLPRYAFVADVLALARLIRDLSPLLNKGEHLSPPERFGRAADGKGDA